MTTFPCKDLPREVALLRLTLFKGDVERGRVCFSKACRRLCLNRGKHGHNVTHSVCGFEGRVETTNQ